jgi:creatinine amidohydrolase/Fe(II)-dependent formamide hydrolase-like protein
MIPYHNVRMDLMSSRQVQQYLRKNDLVVLPVGCFEMHGPDIPLACDTLVAWAQALLLATEWKCLALPPIYFTFPGASAPWPGTVDIPVDVTVNYISAVVQALQKNGFKRVVLCGSHGPLNFILENVVRDIFQKTGQVALHIKPWNAASEAMTKELGYGSGEDVLVLGSLKILGLHGAYHPESKVNKPMEFSFPSMAALKKLHAAAMPWTFGRDYQHTGLRTGVKTADADKVVAAMRKVARDHKDFPKHFAQYQKDMEKLYKQQPWKKAGIWTKTKYYCRK